VSAAAPAAAASAGSGRDRDEPPERGVDAGRSADAAEGADFVLDEVADVGPAAPAAATPSGVVLITRNDELVLARFTRPLRAGGRAAESPIGVVDRPAADFLPAARPPAVLGDAVAWTSKGRLLRRTVSGAGSAEVLATDARDGTRVAAVSDARGSERRVLGYISQSHRGATLTAKLWVEGRAALDLSPAGSAANSVALARAGDDIVAVYLEARTGMTPLHARRIFRRDFRLDDDVVVWVGGSAQSVTEVSALGSRAGDVWAFVAIERDITSFGLARIGVGSEPRMNADVSWRVYPNGLDPAVAAVGNVCGRPSILYARPADKAPRSPQELHLSTIDEDGLSASTIVARSRAFADVTLAEVDGGALVAYTADRRTWARTIRCKQSSK
jgi:hypothetical protein